MIDVFTSMQVYVPQPMPDNPPKVETFRLPGHDVLAITGRDATAFAQAQFMNDVAALPRGHWQWNGWLTPKGRVIALFALLKLDAETLWLLLPDADAPGIAARLQRYVFRSKATLAVRDDLHVAGAFAAPAQASGTQFAIIGDAFELDFGGTGGPRVLRIGPTASPDDDAAAALWRKLDLRHGLPRLRGEQVEAWTPQQLSLDRLKAFSVKKGCYPGQEIVARTHFLGQVKRGLALFKAAGPVAEGASIEADGRAVGTAICVQDDAVLAVMPLERGDALTLTASGTALTWQVALEGLAGI